MRFNVERLKELRTQRGITVVDVCDELNIGTSGYYKKEKGTRPLFADELAKLFDLMELDAYEIAGLFK